MFHSKSEKVWTNIMLLAINEGLKYFKLDHKTFTNHENIYYDFIYNDITFHVNARDIGFEEIAINVYVNWNNGKYNICDTHYTFGTYDIYAYGWLERKTDFYLMEFNKTLLEKRANKLTKQKILNWNIEPLGYKSAGKFIN